LKRWAGILSQINDLIKSVDQKSVKASSLPSKLNTLVSISELNNLAGFANEVRTRIGYSLRSLSISCWNSQDDIDTAIIFIRMALQVNVMPEAKDKFSDD